jgi:hypothetical protein
MRERIAAAIWRADTHWVTRQNTYLDPASLTWDDLNAGWQGYYLRLADAAVVWSEGDDKDALTNVIYDQLFASGISNDYSKLIKLADDITDATMELLS